MIWLAAAGVCLAAFGVIKRNRIALWVGVAVALVGLALTVSLTVGWLSCTG